MEYGASLSLREQMPVVTAFIDNMREAFGTEFMNDIIKRGGRGEPVFWASENGIEYGTKMGDRSKQLEIMRNSLRSKK